MRISYVFEFLFGNRDKQLFLEVLSSACGHIRNKTIFSLLCSAAAYIGAKNISCEKVLYYIYPSSPQYPHASFILFVILITIMIIRVITIKTKGIKTTLGTCYMLYIHYIMKKKDLKTRSNTKENLFFYIKHFYRFLKWYQNYVLHLLKMKVFFC